MIIKANWDIFKAKFSENRQDNFEWFCYLLFSKEYNQPYGTHRYKNQSGIETDPIEVGNEIIGWQSKFYEDSLSNHSDDLMGTLTKSKRDYPNITKIILYTNSEWGQGRGNNDPKAKTDTENKANELGIQLVWRVKSYFESPFVCIENNIISKYFFTQGGFIPSFKFISKKMKDSIFNVGKRYAPNDEKYKSLNQTIPIVDIFNQDVYKKTMKLVNSYLNLNPNSSVRGYTSFDNTKYIQEYMHENKTGINKDEIVIFLENLTKEVFKDYDNLSNALFTITEHLETVKNTLWENDTIQDKGFISKKYKILQQLKELLVSDDTLFYRKSILLIVGEALIGKTHLFCDVTLNRLTNAQPTLLFFGNQLDGTKSIIGNMISQLDLVSVGVDEFLEVLNMWGEEYSTPTLIMIDAINETDNSKIWQEGIIKFCEQIKSYPNLALAMSVRDVEKNKIITPENEEYIANEIVEVEHKGFEGIELEAVRTFCEALEVEFPKVPIHTYRLFVNPGMLFLYIETIKNSTKKVDTSIINPLIIFTSYIEDLERKYYQKYPQDIDEDDEVVSEAIKEFISLGTRQDYIHFYLDYKEVKKKLKPLHAKILEFLISEGVLNKLKERNTTKVYFTYQKFENFFIADYLLGDFELNKENIFTLIREHHGAISEALFMQIPETLGKEIFDLNVWFIRDRYICEQYLQSLIWRRPSTLGDDTFKYINFILGYEDLNNIFLDTMLQLSSIPSHPLNIVRLHKKLLEFNMSERDYYWSIYIHNSFRDDGIVKRIINWAWNKKEKFEIEDESLYLYGLTLGWFLTSSNRELRDGATKALVNLFTDSIDVFLRVLREFKTLDDLYVLDRLYAVGYGIVLRSSREDGLKDLGEYVYQTIFDKDEVIEHILLRDYAKFTVEYIDKSMGLDVDLEKIYPPYNQDIPWELPETSKEEVEKYRDDYLSVYSSALNRDFKIYKVYPLANHFLNLQIKDRPHPKMSEVRYDEFFDSLTQEQKEEYEKVRLQPNELLTLINNITHEEFEEEITIPEIDSNAVEDLRETKLSQSNFKELLSSEQLNEYNDFIVNYKPTGSLETGINVKFVKRLIFLEAIKLGWNKDLFEFFDRNANNGRGSDRGTERIGKKYQWIALYKVLSRLTDNYEFREKSYGEKIVDYKGVYQLSFKRDIDPTTVLKSKYNTENKSWLNIDKSFENLDISDIEWMNNTDKLPTVKQLVNLEREDRESLVLQLSFSIDGYKEGNNYRNLYYNINSFVVKKDCIKSFIDWLGTVDYYGQNKLPQASSMHDMYLREYPDSDAFKHLDTYYHGQVDWEDEFNHSEGVMPCKILLTSTSYMNEGKSYDKSVDETIEVALPNKWFVTEMDLNQTLVDGEWQNRQEEVVFYDPTIEAGSISPYNENGSLVADKKLLMEFLESNGYGLIWIMWGEKQVRSTGDGFNDDEFLGIAEISGYGYFDGDNFVEDMNITFKERD